MRLKKHGQSLSNVIFVVYFLGVMIASVLLAVLSRWECVQDKGSLGIFWCDMFSSIYSSTFKAFLWPYLLYQWLFS